MHQPCSCAVKCLFGAISGVTSRSRTLSGFEKGPDQQGCTEGAQDCPKPRRKYLFFGGLSSPFLSVQICGIVLVAFSLSALVGHSLFRCFENNDWKPKWLLLALPRALASLFFWGWGRAGNPLRAWGLVPQYQSDNYNDRQPIASRHKTTLRAYHSRFYCRSDSLPRVN